jgi:hypothetical protein
MKYKNKKRAILEFLCIFAPKLTGDEMAEMDSKPLEERGLRG